MKVKYFPYQPHCFAFGGFEIQMLATLNAVIKKGVDAHKIDPWSKDDDFNICHSWGLGFNHFDNFKWAKHAKKKIVLTALLSYYESFDERLRHFFSTYIKKAQYYIQIANMADAVVVVNHLQADICHKYFKVPVRKIHVIPNVIHNIFFENTATSVIPEGPNLTDYILTVGSVCQRKNQLKLVKACVANNLNLLIVGRVLEGEENYGRLIEDITERTGSIRWIKGLPANSVELVSAYQSCKVVALPSHIEQQPISLLEGAALRKPLLMGNKLYAKQKYYTNAMLVNPNSEKEIAEGIKQILKCPGKFTTPLSEIEDCREKNVGDMYARLYSDVLQF